MAVEPREYCPVCDEVTPSLLQQATGCTLVSCLECGGWIETIWDEEESETLMATTEYIRKTNGLP